MKIIPIDQILLTKEIGIEELAGSSLKSIFKDLIASNLNVPTEETQAVETVEITEIHKEANLMDKEKLHDETQMIISEVKEILQGIPASEGFFIQSPQFYSSLNQTLDLIQGEAQIIVKDIISQAISIEDILSSDEITSDQVTLLNLLTGLSKLEKTGLQPFEKILARMNDIIAENFPGYEPPKKLEAPDILKSFINAFNLSEDKSANDKELKGINADNEISFLTVNSIPLLKQKDKGSVMIANFQFLQDEASVKTGDKVTLQSALNHDKIDRLPFALSSHLTNADQKVMTENETEPKSQNLTADVSKTINLEQNIPPLKEKTARSEGKTFINQLYEGFKKINIGQFSNGLTKMTLRLTPEHLGMLTIKLQQQNGEMVARIVTSTQSAKELVDQNLHHLKQVLPNISIQVDRFEVFTDHPSENTHQEHHSKDEDEQNQHKNSQESAEKTTGESFKDILNITI